MRTRRLRTRRGSLPTTNGRLRDIYFDHDRSELGVSVWIEGPCGERGSAESNLALGDNRARRIAEMLRSLAGPWRRPAGSPGRPRNRAGRALLVPRADDAMETGVDPAPPAR